MLNTVPSGDDFDRQFDEAVAREAEAGKVEPRARVARFDESAASLVVSLASGVTLSIPVRLVSELADLAPTELAAVSVSPSGEGLMWDAADVHISVPGLVWELFGSDFMAREAVAAGARRAAGTKTEARSRAARENGRKGGRPRKAGS